MLENVRARREWCERTLELFRGIDELTVTGWGPRESPTEALHYGLELMEWMRGLVRAQGARAHSSSTARPPGGNAGSGPP